MKIQKSSRLETIRGEPNSTHLVFIQTQLNNPIRITQLVIRILRDLPQPNVVRRLTTFQNRVGPTRNVNRSARISRGEVGPGQRPGQNGNFDRLSGGVVGVRVRRRRGSRRVGVGTVAFQIQLQEIEESAGYDRAKNETSPALNHAL